MKNQTTDIVLKLPSELSLEETRMVNNLSKLTRDKLRLAGGWKNYQFASDMDLSVKFEHICQDEQHARSWAENHKSTFLGEKRVSHIKNKIQ